MFNVVAQEVDGEALLGVFGCQAVPDCLKDALPKFGQRIKVYRAIKDKANDKNGDSATGILSRSSIPNSSSQEVKLLVYYCLM